MNNKKLGTILILALLALGISWLIPNVVGAGKKEDKEKQGLSQRVEVLEELVGDLMARVEELEAGGGSCACSCDVLHLTPLADLPADPSEGDLCVVGEGEERALSCYLNGDWRTAAVAGGGTTPPRE